MKTRVRTGLRLKLSALATLALAALARDSFAYQLHPEHAMVAVEIVAVGLQDPAGLAVHPTDETLYVAERSAGRVVQIRDKRPVTCLETNFLVHDTAPFWALNEVRSVALWTDNVLREPADIAFDPDGRLYVAEAAEDGRLLRFRPMADGLALGNIIPGPFADGARGFRSIRVDAQGRLFATASRGGRGDEFTMGCVLMRNADGNWWLVDYNPFAQFSNPAIGPAGGGLLVAEAHAADATWYDVDRRAPMNGAENLNGVRFVEILPDGTSLACMENIDGTFAIAEIDPISGQAQPWIEGLSEIGGVCADPQSGDFYVSLRKEGSVLRVRRIDQEQDIAGKRDSRVKNFEMLNTLPPRDWPQFFRDFVEKLGVVQPVNDTAALADAEPGRAETRMTMGEFASSLPVVAGRMRASLLSAVEMERDPIQGISFLIFNPKRSAVAVKGQAPTISLLRVERDSGSIEKTTFMHRQNNALASQGKKGPSVMLSIPSGYFVPPSELGEPGLCRLYYIGMGLGSDYWIDLNLAADGQSRMTVENPDGSRIVYALTPETDGTPGGADSILVAGMNKVETSWIPMGKAFAHWKLVLDDEPMRLKHCRSVAQLLKDYGAPKEPRMLTWTKTVPAENDWQHEMVMRAAAEWDKTYF